MLDKLVAILDKILMLVFSFTLPETDPGVLDILGDLPSMIKGRIIRNKLCMGTVHLYAVLKCSKETFCAATLNLEDVGNAKNQTNKNMSFSFSSINSGRIGVNHVGCIGFLTMKKVRCRIWQFETFLKVCRQRHFHVSGAILKSALDILQR